MAIKIFVEETFQLELLLTDGRAESDERRCAAHLLDGLGRFAPNRSGGGIDEIGHEGIDHAPHCFVDQAAPRESGEKLQHRSLMTLENGDVAELLELDEPRPQPIVTS